jgi:hypothetical protein
MPADLLRYPDHFVTYIDWLTRRQWAGSGSELLGALTAIPRLLDPATQLRTLVTELRPMTRAVSHHTCQHMESPLALYLCTTMAVKLQHKAPPRAAVM